MSPKLFLQLIFITLLANFCEASYYHGQMSMPMVMAAYFNFQFVRFLFQTRMLARTGMESERKRRIQVDKDIAKQIAQHNSTELSKTADAEKKYSSSQATIDAMTQLVLDMIKKEKQMFNTRRKEVAKLNSRQNLQDVTTVNTLSKYSSYLDRLKDTSQNRIDEKSAGSQKNVVINPNTELSKVIEEYLKNTDSEINKLTPEASSSIEKSIDESLNTPEKEISDYIASTTSELVDPLYRNFVNNRESIQTTIGNYYDTLNGEFKNIKDGLKNHATAFEESSEDFKDKFVNTKVVHLAKLIDDMKSFVDTSSRKSLSDLTTQVKNAELKLSSLIENQLKKVLSEYLYKAGNDFQDIQAVDASKVSEYTQKMDKKVNEIWKDFTNDITKQVGNEVTFSSANVSSYLNGLANTEDTLKTLSQNTYNSATQNMKTLQTSGNQRLSQLNSENRAVSVSGPLAVRKISDTRTAEITKHQKNYTQSLIHIINANLVPLQNTATSLLSKATSNATQNKYDVDLIDGNLNETTNNSITSNTKLSLSIKTLQGELFEQLDTFRISLSEEINDSFNKLSEKAFGLLNETKRSVGGSLRVLLSTLLAKIKSDRQSFSTAMNSKITETNNKQRSQDDQITKLSASAKRTELPVVKEETTIPEIPVNDVEMKSSGFVLSSSTGDIINKLDGIKKSAVESSDEQRRLSMQMIGDTSKRLNSVYLDTQKSNSLNPLFKNLENFNGENGGVIGLLDRVLGDFNNALDKIELGSSNSLNHSKVMSQSLIKINRHISSDILKKGEIYYSKGNSSLNKFFKVLDSTSIKYDEVNSNNQKDMKEIDRILSEKMNQFHQRLSSISMKLKESEDFHKKDRFSFNKEYSSLKTKNAKYNDDFEKKITKFKKNYNAIRSQLSTMISSKYLPQLSAQISQNSIELNQNISETNFKSQKLLSNIDESIRRIRGNLNSNETMLNYLNSSLIGANEDLSAILPKYKISTKKAMELINEIQTVEKIKAESSRLSLKEMQTQINKIFSSKNNMTESTLNLFNHFNISSTSYSDSVISSVKNELLKIKKAQLNINNTGEENNKILNASYGKILSILRNLQVISKYSRETAETSQKTLNTDTILLQNLLEGISREANEGSMSFAKLVERTNKFLQISMKTILTYQAKKYKIITSSNENLQLFLNNIKNYIAHNFSGLYKIIGKDDFNRASNSIIKDDKDLINSEEDKLSSIEDKSKISNNLPMVNAEIPLIETSHISDIKDVDLSRTNSAIDSFGDMLNELSHSQFNSLLSSMTDEATSLSSSVDGIMTNMRFVDNEYANLNKLLASI